MNKVFLFLLLLLIVIKVEAQTGFGWGSATGPFTPITSGYGFSPTTLFSPSPSAASGTIFYGITSGSGGSLSAANEGLSQIGIETEAVASASSGYTYYDYCKFGIYNYNTANSKEAFNKFEIVLGGSTGDNYSDSGVWYYCTGDGGFGKFLYANNNVAFNLLEQACVIRFTLCTNGTIYTDYYTSTMGWDTLVVGLTQGTKYVFEVYVNNDSKTSGFPTYTKNSNTYTVTNNKMDIWINNVRIAAGIYTSAPLCGGCTQKKIDSWCFWGNGSNTAYIFTDNILYGGKVSSGSSNDYYSKSTGYLDTLSTWGVNTDGSGTQPSNFTDAYTNFYIRNNSTPTLNADWAVSGIGSTVIVGDGINDCNFTVPTSYAFTGLVDISALGTLSLQNSNLPTFGIFSDSSTVIYNHSGDQLVTGYAYYNLKTSSNGVKSANGTVEVKAELYLASSSTLDLQTYKLAGTLSTISNNGIIKSAHLASTGMNPIPTSRTWGGIVNYYGNAAQTIMNGNYSNLTLAGTGNKTLESSGSIVVDDTLSIHESAIFAKDASSTISYGSGGVLDYSATTSYNTNEEWPATSGPSSLIVNSTVNYNLDRSLSGNATINSGKILNILAAASLEIIGTLTNSNGTNTGNLNILSDTAGTGNLICSTTGIYGTVQRYITGSTNNPYHYISSPISSSPFSNIWSSGDYNAYYYDETVVNADLDIGWTRITSGSLDNGKGYAIVGKSTVTRSFSGVLNAATISPSVSYTATTNPGVWPKSVDPRGWNLIGNPYPCALKITGNDFLDNIKNKLDGSYQAVYFWDDPAATLLRGDYSSYNSIGGANNSGSSGALGADNYIPVGQGFFIKLKDSLSGSSYNTTISFCPSQKIANNGYKYFIPDLVDFQKFWFSISNEDSLYNEILLGFSNTATKEFDPGYDAIKLKGNPNIALYSLLENNNLIIQGLPSISEEMIVPFGFDIKTSGIYTFTVRAKENFTHEKVYLKDKETNTLSNLNIDTFYTFSAISGENKTRFELIFTPEDQRNSISEKAKTKNVFCVNNQLFYESAFDKTCIKVFDINGKLILNKEVTGKGMHKLDLELNKGLYIVKLSTATSVITREIINY